VLKLPDKKTNNKTRRIKAGGPISFLS